MSLNVDNSKKDDPSYRYTMPKAQCKLEKQKTVVENLKDIGASLHRHPEEILQYIGCKLNSQATKDKHGKHYVKGDHRDTIQELIFEYIDIFVMCPQCCLPETIYKFRFKSKKDIKVKYTCKACGAKDELSQSTPKVYKYICKTPQNYGADKRDKKKDKKKDKKRDKKRDKKNTVKEDTIEKLP
jgi:translation initiation factor 5